MDGMTMDGMTTAEAVQVLESCAHEYLHRVEAFGKLRAAALLAHQMAEVRHQHEEHLEGLRLACAALEEEAGRAQAHSESLRLDLARERQTYDLELRSLRRGLAQEQGQCTQELQAWKAVLAEEQRQAQQQNAQLCRELREEAVLLEEHIRQRKAFLAATRQQLMQLTELPEP